MRRNIFGSINQLKHPTQQPLLLKKQDLTILPFFTDQTIFTSTFNNMTKNRRTRKSTAPAGLKTPPPKRKHDDKDSPDTASTNSLSSMSMSFDGGSKPNIDSPPFKGMRKQDIPWMSKDLLVQAFKAVGVKGSVDKALRDSRNIELLLGNQRKPYKVTLEKLGINNSWKKYKTKEFRIKVAEAVANTLQG